MCPALSPIFVLQTRHWIRASCLPAPASRWAAKAGSLAHAQVFLLPPAHRRVGDSSMRLCLPCSAYDPDCSAALSGASWGYADSGLELGFAACSSPGGRRAAELEGVRWASTAESSWRAFDLKASRGLFQQPRLLPCALRAGPGIASACSSRPGPAGSLRLAANPSAAEHLRPLQICGGNWGL